MLNHAVNYSTVSGAAYLGDSIDLIKLLDDASVDLICTSPPFALLRQKQFRILSKSTVLPTPRSPIIKILFACKPRRVRSMATSTVFRSSSRPASSGGGVPAPGENGFVFGSICSVYKKFRMVYVGL